MTIPFALDDIEARYVQMNDDQKADAEAAALLLLSCGDYSFRTIVSILTDEDRNELRRKLDAIMMEDCPL